LSACGNAQNTNTDSYPNEDNPVTETVMPITQEILTEKAEILPQNYSDIIIQGDYYEADGMVYKNDTFFTIAHHAETYEDSYRFYSDIIKVELNGKEPTKKQITPPFVQGQEGSFSIYSGLKMTPDGAMCALKINAESYNSEYGYSDYEFKYSVVSFDDSLNESIVFDISSAIEKSDEIDHQYGNDLEIKEFLIDKDNVLYLVSHYFVYVFDIKTDEFIYLVTTYDEEGDPWFDHLFIYDGKAAVDTHLTLTPTDDDKNMVGEQLRILDSQNRGYGEYYDLRPTTFVGGLLSGNETYPIIVSNGENLSSFDPKTSEFTPLVDFEALGLEIYPENITILQDVIYVTSIEKDDTTNKRVIKMRNFVY
jgi:hypothetical protein